MFAISGGRPQRTSITGMRIVVLVLHGDERRQKRAERELLLARLVIHRVRLVEQERDAAAARCYPQLLQSDAEAILEHGAPATIAARPDRHRDATSEIDRDLSDRALRRIDDLALDACDSRELVDRVAHVVGDRGRERSLVAQARAEVAPDDDPPFAFGHPLELLEQHRLPDPAQARDPKVAALLRIILEQPREAVELLVTTCEERRSSPDARLVRVLRHSCGDRTDLHRGLQDPVNFSISCADPAAVLQRQQGTTSSRRLACGQVGRI